MDSGFYPLVSIVIPVYNGSDYLKEAIESAIHQTYKNIEVIVVNDGSKDNGITELIAKEYGNKITYISKVNGGVSSALNAGIKNMKGDYFSWLSHDDVYPPDKIETQLKYIKQWNNNFYIPYGNLILINSKSKIINKVKIKDLNSLEAVMYGQINGCTLLIPKVVFNIAGNFDEQLKATQDYDLWFRITKSPFVFKYIDYFFLKSRSHANQGSKNINTFYDERDRMIMKFIKDANEVDIRKIDNKIYPFYFRYSSSLFSRLILNGSNLAMKEGLKYYKKKYPNASGILTPIVVTPIYLKGIYNIIKNAILLSINFKELKSSDILKLIKFRWFNSFKKKAQ